jgi:hypothetical protein
MGVYGEGFSAYRDALLEMSVGEKVLRSVASYAAAREKPVWRAESTTSHSRREKK